MHPQNFVVFRWLFPFKDCNLTSSWIERQLPHFETFPGKKWMCGDYSLCWDHSRQRGLSVFGLRRQRIHCAKHTTHTSSGCRARLAIWCPRETTVYHRETAGTLPITTQTQWSRPPAHKPPSRIYQPRLRPYAHRLSAHYCVWAPDTYWSVVNK